MSSNELVDVSRYFKHWCKYLRDAREKRIWEEDAQEELDELEYSAENGLDPVYWCWNCKYSECERHQCITWEYETLSDTD
jgi:hypothetical protein